MVKMHARPKQTDGQSPQTEEYHGNSATRSNERIAR